MTARPAVPDDAVDLRASPDGEPLYEKLGFVRTADPAMRLSLPPRPASPADRRRQWKNCGPYGCGRSGRPGSG